MANVEIIGLKELQRAVNRNPKKVLNETDKFLTKGMAAYKRGIIRSPWRIGASGGGAPKKTGNLRDTHHTDTISKLKRSIGPTAKYAKYVHGIPGIARKRSYQLRPWLDHTKKTKAGEIQKLYGLLLKNITSDLAK
jgi:hypothetical protein